MTDCKSNKSFVVIVPELLASAAKNCAPCSKDLIPKICFSCGSSGILDLGIGTEKIETYNKRHSFTLAGEDKVYTSGLEKIIINYKDWKICPLICYDLRFPVWARNTENYDLLIFVANWPKQRISAWDTLLKARAIENVSYVIGINRTGKDDNYFEYSGYSMIVDFLGEEISNLKNNEIGIIKATLIKKEQDNIRKELGFLNDKDTFQF